MSPGTCFPYKPNIATKQKSNRQRVPRLPAALLKDRTVLAKVGHVGPCREHITNHLPGRFLLISTLVAKREISGIS